MSPFDAIGQFALGLIKSGHVQGWYRLIASVLATAFVTFWGILGIALVQGSGWAVSFGTASLAMSLAVLGIWLRSPLTKGIPILYPSKIEAARIEQLTADGSVFNPNEKR